MRPAGFWPVSGLSVKPSTNGLSDVTFIASAIGEKIFGYDSEWF